MATCIFRSSLADRLQGFFDMRCISRRNKQQSMKILIYIDRFLFSALKPGEAITYDLINRWIKEMDYLSVNTRINRICIMRQFCHYLSFFDPRTCIVHNSFLPYRTRPAPYIYSHKDVQSIMAAAKRIGPSGSLRPEVITTLFGLLYATGIRIGEALRLIIGDVDINRQLLTIRETKFKKTRYVPLSQSTVHSLVKYLSKRSKAGFSTDSDAPVFVNLKGHNYLPSSISEVFLEIVRGIGLRGPKGQPGPRLHDFRHTFAVNRLAEWYRQGVNIGAKLPLLTTYLGHTTVTCTQIYLQATAELLEEAGEKFYHRFSVPLMGGREAENVKKY